MNATIKSRILDALERAGWSAGQALVAVLLTTGAVSDARHLQWGPALGTAAGAFIVSAIATGLVYLSPLQASSFRADLGLRLVKTFVSAFGGAIGTDAFNAFTFDWGAALSVALLATLGAFGKGFLARQETAGADNPSTLKPTTYQLTQPGAKVPEPQGVDKNAAVA